MTTHPAAEQDPIPGRAGLSMVGGTRKGIAHSTEGGSYAGARGAYVSRGVPPHFTIEGRRLIQHIDCDLGSYAMGNSSGGVETNRGGRHVVQVELVGFAGRGFDAGTLATFTALQAWCAAELGIPPVWPAGRPPKDSRSVPDASTATWVQRDGWFAHCQVPEQEGRWDPGFTDADWTTVSAAIGPAGTEDDLTPEQAKIQLEQTELLRKIWAATNVEWAQWKYPDGKPIRNIMEAVHYVTESVLARVLAGLEADLGVRQAAWRFPDGTTAVSLAQFVHINTTMVLAALQDQTGHL